LKVDTRLGEENRLARNPVWRLSAKVVIL
jgi:hypothetical protein